MKSKDEQAPKPPRMFPSDTAQKEKYYSATTVRADTSDSEDSNSAEEWIKDKMMEAFKWSE